MPSTCRRSACRKRRCPASCATPGSGPSKIGTYLRPVLGAVRQGTRVHADPRQGGLAAADYTAWVDAKKKEAAAAADDPNKVWDLAGLEARGEQVYTANCQVCHQPNGKGGGAGQAARRLGDGARRRQDQADQRAAARPACPWAMPAWKGKLSDTEIAAVITFTKNHWSNATGQIVQPSEVVGRNERARQVSRRRRRGLRTGLRPQ